MKNLSSISNKYTGQKSANSGFVQKKQMSFSTPFIQPKVVINKPNDSHEQRSTFMADKVMCTPQQNFIQRKCEECERDKQKLHRKPLNQNTTPFLQPKSESNIAVDNSIAHSIQSLKGLGSSLGGNTQSFMSSRFGNDFTNVKIHTDSEAIQLSRSFNAKAFTVGSDIYFNQGQYRPASSEGRHLLAHELTHVVQQKGIQPMTIQRAEIDYKQLTWADFKGAPPKDAGYDAETVSDIHYPDLAKITPQIINKATGQDCTRQGKASDAKDKQYEAKIRMASGGIKASAFMSQEKSWVKPLFKDPAEMKKFCGCWSIYTNRNCNLQICNSNHYLRKRYKL